MRSRHKRKRPARLAGKLLKIRTELQLSQDDMLRRLGLEDEFGRDYISKFERDVLEPPLHVLLRYANVANIYLDVLASDALDLPPDLPASFKSAGVPLVTTHKKVRR